MSSGKVLVTGAGGFLGTYLVKELLRQNYQIVLFTSQKEKFSLLDASKIRSFDHSDWKKGNIPFGDIDVLINCAFARSSDAIKIADSVRFTNDFIGDAVAQGTRSIINISSQSVYDQKRQEAAKEATLVKPETLYGMAKYSSELIISRICTDMRIPYSNIRLGSLVGIEFEVRLTNRFIKKAINKEKIVISGGNQIISYLHIVDAANALIAMLHRDPSRWKELYNLSSHENWRLMDLAIEVSRLSAALINSEVEVIHNSSDDLHNISLDSSLFYEDFKWKPKYSMDDILVELINHYKDDKIIK